jgi:uncharacterized Tic20 family protein
MDMKPSTEERIWAVLSHLSALAFGMGVLLPIIGWSEQRRKSKYASFQCLQALGYQSLGYTVWLLAYMVAFILLMVVFAFAAGAAGGDNRIIDAWTMIFTLLVFAGFGLYIIVPVVAAVSCALGKDFHYPLMGKKLAAYLGYGNTSHGESRWIEEHEEHWVASMSHFTVIIALWGLIAPFTVWVVQGRNSVFLRFQSIQTSMYQVFVNIVYLGAMGLAFLGVIPLFALTGLEGTPVGNSPMATFGLVLFMLSMLIAGIVLLLLPLFHILGQWAGYRVLKGDDYRYPVIGRLVEKWMVSKEPFATDGGLSAEGKTI